MALQDQTLANTQAKMGMEAARQRRERNAQATFASVTTGGPRRSGELPWWAAKDVPGSGFSSARVGLQGLGGLMLGVAGRRAAKQAQHHTDLDYVNRGLRGRAIPERAVLPSQLSRQENPGPAGMSPAQMASIRVSLQTTLDEEGLSGVERLTRENRFPASVLETIFSSGVERLTRENRFPASVLETIFSSGGQNGAPAGGGLPELGV